jgi:23S rRNA (adenine2503-C2)-methyltransferase
MVKTDIFGYTVDQLKEICFQESFPAYAADQIADWMYKKRITDFQLMSNLSKAHRDILSNQYCVSPALPVHSSVSSDGTIKYLFSLHDDHHVEAVYIPDGERATVCISVQAGCALGCVFCQTAQMKTGRNLQVGEILSQVLFLPEFEKLTNIVIMGMGEPLMNWENVKIALEILSTEKYVGMSKKRFTLSTVGIIPELKDFLQTFPCELAISMHSPFSEERKQLMPVENKYPLAEVLYLVRRYTSGSSRVVSFEYIVFKGLNHSQKHADEIARILNGIPCKINLISMHSISACELESPERTEMESFQQALKNKGFTVTIRKSRGIDIEAACGMLSCKRNS